MECLEKALSFSSFKQIVMDGLENGYKGEGILGRIFERPGEVSQMS